MGVGRKWSNVQFKKLGLEGRCVLKGRVFFGYSGGRFVGHSDVVFDLVSVRRWKGRPGGLPIGGLPKLTSLASIRSGLAKGPACLPNAL
jgi:hypothetical protein